MSEEWVTFWGFRHSCIEHTICPIQCTSSKVLPSFTKLLCLKTISNSQFESCKTQANTKPSHGLRYLSLGSISTPLYLFQSIL